MALVEWLQAGTAFDGLASRYDELWTHSTVGRLQRETVWRRVDSLVQRGDLLLDLGCGTGEDSLHFAKLGAEVKAIDASCEMVRVARSRGVRASVLGIEDLDYIVGRFDGAISDFGALNCVSDLKAVRDALSSLIRPGGYLALCVLGRFSLWETMWYLLCGDPRRAFRRFQPGRWVASLQVRVYHFSVRHLEQAFHPEFTLIDWRGIGLCVPPSYIRHIPNWLLRVFGRVDRRVAHWPLLRALADHRLLIFTRNRAD
jgi:SAM-dependent methyltransferase